MRLSLLRRLTLSGASALLIAFAAAPAHAQLGGIVYDPSNYSQNVLTAARTLQQINNQIRSLQNEAEGLINDAKNLAALPFSSLAELQSQVRQTQQLLSNAQRIAYSVQSIDQAFAGRYRADNLSASDKALIANARARWEDTVAAFEDALKVQAGVVGNIEGSRSVMDRLVGSSQSASGALQAAQAGNQLLALQARQLADLTALVAAQGRAQSLEAAQRAAAQDQAREQLRRFLAPGAGYRSAPAKMFHD
ncbi:P-type conjugative transfer protein TrbJ [Sphingomonas sp. HF-S4]|uniref:P-type conjugative transfer protein TrbJ n=2 Tax=Sphingomonas TaxID=13687 RepID=A0A4V5PTV0_9SPHN|nr:MULTISPECIES: P-type conjugative transfer protein TrbJ [Sphingomonas]MDV3458238.1 P-type conjugative transfer protein TrbJ [Sphingomonas sp. HF-S4]TKD51458.1 P-type conjugative transfer protein TrbJ [Sphingomonas baiyangensis]